MSAIPESRTWESVRCTFVIERPARGIVVLRISGHDVGEFGDEPMRELERHIGEEGVIELFIDARNTEGATIDVSSDWAQWLGAHRAACERISMLTGSRFVQLTAEFVRRFAGLGEIMRLYATPADFDEALAVATKAATSQLT